MSLTDRETTPLDQLVTAWKRPRERLSADRLADELCWNTWTMEAAARSVRTDVDELVRLREGRFAEAVQAKLNAADAPYPFLARRLHAVLQAAEAARHRRHGRPGESVAYLERAIAAWTGQDHDLMARTQVTDLVESLVTGTDDGDARQAQMAVPVHGGEGLQLVTLVAEIAEGRQPGAWPCPRGMAFTEIDPETAAEMATVFAAHHGRRPVGVRWRLIAPSGRTLRVLRRTSLAGALAVLVESIVEKTPVEDSMTVVAGADPDGRLIASDDAAELAAYARRYDKRVVVQGIGTRTFPSWPLGRQPANLSAPDVPSALGLIRKRAHRKLARRTAVAVGAAAVILAGFGLRADEAATERAERAEAARLAQNLADQVKEQHTGAPDKALARALAAQRIAPGNVAARSALLTSVYGDVRLRELLRGAPQPLRALVMARDGRTVAATGESGKIAVWSLGAVPSPAPRIIRTGDPVTAMALTADGRTLAYASRTSGVRSADLTAAGKTSVYRMPEAGLTVNALGFAPDGAVLAAATSSGSVVWRGPGDEPPERLGRGIDVAAVAFDRAGESLAQTGPDGEISVWRVGGESVQRSAESSLGSPGTGVVFAPDGKVVYAITSNGQIHYLDARTGRRLRAPFRFAVSARLLMATGSGLWVAHDSGVEVLNAEVLDGERLTLVEPSIATGATVKGIAAVSSDGSVTVTPAGDGSLAVHALVTHDTVGWYSAGIFRVVPLPGGDLAFGLTALLGKSPYVVVFDRTRGTAVAAQRYPSKFSFSPGDFSTLTRSAAVITRDGRVLLWRYDGERRLTRLAELRRPSGSSARGQVAFDDRHRRLLVVWGTELVTYSYDGGGPPSEVARTKLPRPLGCMTVDSPRARLIGCTRLGLEMWPLHADGRPGEPVSLASRPTLQAMVAADGTVIGFGRGGEAFAYDIGATGATQRSLPGHERYLTTMTILGGDLITASRTGHVNIVDIGSGELLLRTRFPEVGDFPTAAWRDATGLHLSMGLGAQRADLLTDPAALAAHGCRMAGWKGPRPSVSDVLPEAPQRLRDKPLCPDGR